MSTHVSPESLNDDWEEVDCDQSGEHDGYYDKGYEAGGAHVRVEVCAFVLFGFAAAEEPAVVANGNEGPGKVNRAHEVEEAEKELVEFWDYYDDEEEG